MSGSFLGQSRNYGLAGGMLHVGSQMLERGNPASDYPSIPGGFGVHCETDDSVRNSCHKNGRGCLRHRFADFILPKTLNLSSFEIRQMAERLEPKPWQGFFHNIDLCRIDSSNC